LWAWLISSGDLSASSEVCAYDVAYIVNKSHVVPPITNYNYNKGFTVGVFIDFQSAFDMMWQSGLLVKL